MNSTESAAPDREQKLAEILLQYVDAVEAGQAPDRRDVLARHPEFADELREFFAGRDQLEILAAPLRAAAGLSATRRPPSTEAPRSEGKGATEELGQIGDFRLLREVGRGGMGVVYEAEQLSLNRRVALKVLPFAAALDPRQLQRFKHEAQAAAQLHHPNIVPVYGVGTERSVHYYAMQFIDGRSLADLIEDMRPADKKPDAPGAGRASTAPVAALSTQRGADTRAYMRRVAELGLKAAEALHHAHEEGVVHRDIKPANLLLDAGGRLWITDFGLALMGSDGKLTSTGELVGTLRYMSPEQALAKRGLVDHRTDIYSLGATLYELLTLRPAFDGEHRYELLQNIASGEPAPPRKVAPAVPVELETIILKAMARTPAERYTTAQEMADDLRRFLEDRPILARRPTMLDRLRKWSRRHRSVVVSATLLLAMGVIGLVVTTLLLAREQAETKAAYERERQKAREAEESFRQALRAVNFFAQVSEEDLANIPPLQGLRRRLLEEALNYYQGFLDQRRDDPTLREELAASHARVNKLLGELAALEGHGQFPLLTEPDVQKALGLSPDQARRVKELADRRAEQWRKGMEEPRLLSKEQQRQRTLEVARSTEKAVAEILTHEQAARLRQVALQLRQRGPDGFTTAEVADALKLTKDQRGRIRGIQDDAHRAMWDKLRTHMGQGGPPCGPEDLWGDVEGKVMAVLTTEQKARWHELTGERFTGEVRFRPPPLLGPALFPPGPPGFGPPPGVPHDKFFKAKGSRKGPKFPGP
jgi:eukaryotic-like serine/threonine-protein kinase